MKAIIFDMDGVLIDSPKINFESFDLVLNKYGVKLDESKKQIYLGRSLKDQIKIWQDEFPEIPKNIDIADFSREAYVFQKKIIEKEVKPNPSVINLINKAREENIKIAVATSSTRFRAEDILKHLEIFKNLDILVTTEEISKGKPDPEIFLKTAEKLNVNPKECVVIEDAVNGIQAANAANMKSVAKITEYHTEKEFTEADYYFENFENLNIEDLKALFG